MRTFPATALAPLQQPANLFQLLEGLVGYLYLTAIAAMVDRDIQSERIG